MAAVTRMAQRRQLSHELRNVNLRGALGTLARVIRWSPNGLAEGGGRLVASAAIAFVGNAAQPTFADTPDRSRNGAANTVTKDGYGFISHAPMILGQDTDGTGRADTGQGIPADRDAHYFFDLKAQEAAGDALNRYNAAPGVVVPRQVWGFGPVVPVDMSARLPRPGPELAAIRGSVWCRAWPWTRR
jgi:hypothetical protein